MKWVYILECEYNYFYVGETKRLYRRFWEHFGKTGGLNTKIHRPKNIIALYKVNTISNFIDYNEVVIHRITNENSEYRTHELLRDFNDEPEFESNSKDVENYIAELLMINNPKEWKKIRGGKYVKFDVEYKFPIDKYEFNIPMCKCNLPCDVKKNNLKNYLFFRCSKKNIWEHCRNIFDINEEACNFYMEYTLDKNHRIS